MATVSAGINNQVFGERYLISRVVRDQYGNVDESGAVEPFECVGVPQEKEFSQKLDGERIGVNFKGDVTLTVPFIRFRKADLPPGFIFKELDRIEQLDHEQNAYVVEYAPPASSNDLISVKVSVA
ncbi:hypothetical protein [Cohaesibacter intestini]|uniref:hypothetical protein n=1 Tax=Cohaesibacter intestini TaxID=2211145 RepID=UPI0013003CCB|nr:hypothetical protein [Cohaesibacter intestini]